MTRTVLVMGLLWGSVGLADDVPSGGQEWSVVSARTAGLNRNQLDAAFGWPGLNVTYHRGLLDNFDLGARFTLDYGQYGMVTYPLFAGLGLQALVKVKFLDTGKVNAGLSFMPGMGFTFPPYSQTQVSFLLPLELRLGIVASSALNLGISFGMPMRVFFGPGRGFIVPIMMGAGAEYFLRSDVALTFDLKMGPTIFAYGNTAAFTLDGKFGVGWHF